MAHGHDPRSQQGLHGRRPSTGRDDTVVSIPPSPLGSTTRTRPVRIDPDTVSPGDIAARQGALVRSFMNHVLIALILGLIVMTVTIVQVVVDPWWTLWFRVFAAIRVVLLTTTLFMTCCKRRHIHIIRLYGTGEHSQALIALSPFPTLWAWRIIGYFDIYLGRILPLVINIVAAFQPELNIPVHVFLIRIAVDFATTIEYTLVVWLVHNRGIWANVVSKLLTRQQSVN